MRTSINLAWESGKWKAVSAACGYHIDQLVWLTLANRSAVKCLYYSFPINWLPLNDLVHNSLKQLPWGELLKNGSGRTFFSFK